MAFPPCDRVIYDRNPLKQVICQLQFPPILKIDSKPPSEFQERIRQRFPLLREMAVPQSPELAALPNELAMLIGARQSGRITWEFATADDKWKASLSRNFLALACTEYRRWEQFKDHMAGPFDALIAEYGPAFCTRVGLRYVDVIQRSALGLEGVEWRDLLQPHIAGELGSNLTGEIKNAARQVIVDLGENRGQVQIQHGLAKRRGEPVYSIDSDFSTPANTKTEIGGVIERLNFFNRQAASLFRWCITERLHDAMGPAKIS